MIYMDPTLSKLIEKSPSINTMPEDERLRLVASFDGLDEDRLNRVKSILLKEMEEEEAATKAESLTPDDLKKAIEMLHTLQNKFKKLEIRTNAALEKTDSKKAEDVLKELDEVFDKKKK